MTDMDKAINEAISDLPAGFKMTELGPLPEEWKIATLGEIAIITLGQSPPSSTYNMKREGIPFLQGKAEFGEVFPRPLKWCTSPEKIAKKGSILISVRAPVGDVNFADDDYCIGRGLAAILSKNNLDNWFLFNLLRFLKPKIEEKGTGSIFKSITKDVLYEFLIPLPPLPEQRAIAHVLHTVQRAKEATERVIQATRELKKSLMRHLFTYGPVSVHDAENVSLKETEIGLVPEHWQIVRLEEVVQETSQVDPQRTPEWRFRYIDVSSVSNDSLSIQSFKEYLGKDAPSRARKQIASGDVIFATVRPYLRRIAIVPPEFHGQICSTAFCVIRTKPEIADNYYVFLVVSDDRFVQRVSERQRGSSYPAVTDSDVLTELIPLPPPSEQREIVGILMAVDKKLQTEEARKQVLETLFKTLLHHLMTGKVRVKSSET